jgi:hypothetical protein
MSGIARSVRNNRCFVDHPAFYERLFEAQNPTDPFRSHCLPAVSSFRPEPMGPQGVPLISVKPTRPISHVSSIFEHSDDTAHPQPTPCGESLKLVDGDMSIYRNSCSSQWRECPLCLYCYRQHGSFNRIGENGCELCGREEVLESHYWE